MITENEKDAVRRHYARLAANLPEFRPRRAQRVMLAEIAKTFARASEIQDGKWPERKGESIIVIEGPTGVGKSLAYLLAGVVMAQSRGKKLLVSSATVALQEQLVKRDLPFLAENGGLEMSYALAKGRGRYLCPYRLYQITQNTAQGEFQGAGFDMRALLPQKISAAEREILHDMAERFAARTFDGDRDEWKGEKLPDALWQRVANDRYGCLKNACANRAECPFYLARDTLDEADVIVANHDLLLSDAAVGGGVILPAPEACFYAIDEAHHLPKKAVSRFAAGHSLNEAVQFLKVLPNAVAKVDALTGKADLANAAENAADGLSALFKQWNMLLNQSTVFPDEAQKNERVWLWEQGKIPENLLEITTGTAQSAQQFLKYVRQLGDALAQARRERPEEAAEIDEASADFGNVIAYADSMAAVWVLLAEQTEENRPPLAKWIVLNDSGKPDYLFHASPVSAAAQLVAQLWRRAAGAVLTSATLRALGDFDLFLRQTGLAWLPEVQTLALESPFDLKNRVELYIPPLPATPKDPDAHTDAVAAWLPQLIDPNEPIGTLVLFSSRRQMEEVALRLPENFLPLLRMQGEMSKSDLLAAHHAAVAAGSAAIIFGLDSFAEGLDLPGEACMHVIIAKIPFTMPDNPVDKTANRWIEIRGGNPFIEVSVPEAAVKLTQAFGRLIRRESDYGRVTILDTRLLTRSYGKRILDTLPPHTRL